MQNMINRRKPTYENQLLEARRLLKEKGLEALRNPHALTGRQCGCGECFTCATLQVWNEVTSNQPVKGASQRVSHDDF